jgi:hypothetical protein
MQKDRYDPGQWELMNRPEMQARIRQSFKGYLQSFLDTAPDGKTQERFVDVLSFLRAYFVRELEEPTEYTELILSSLSAAVQYIPSEATLREVFDAPSRPVTDADIESYKRLQERIERDGLEGWWDSAAWKKPKS